MENNSYQDLQQYLVFNPNDLNKVECKWTENNSKLLIDLYAKYRDKVGTLQLRSVKSLWEKIAEELRKLNINVTPNNCLNRWRVLERNYKKFVDNNNKTGRGRKYFEYQKEMEEIFSKKKNVHPVLLLASDTKDDLPQNEINSKEKTPQSSDLPQDKVVDGNPVEEKKQSEETLRAKHSKSKILRKKTTTIEKIRLDRKEYYDQRLEIERQKLVQMERRNNLIAERNAILSERD